MTNDEEYYRRCVQSIVRDRRQILEDYFDEIEYDGLPYIVSYNTGKRDGIDRMWKVFAMIFGSVFVGTVFLYAITHR